MRKNTIYFANRAQVALYECELSGQISDGHWENSRPWDHWKIMCRAEVKVHPEGLTGLTFMPERKYGFSSPSLVDVVGGRMLWYVKLALTHPELSFRDIENSDNMFSIEICGATPKFRFSVAEYRKVPEHSAAWLADYRQDNIEKAKALFNVESDEDLQAEVDKVWSHPYSLKDLRRDLRQMSKIVNSVAWNNLIRD